MGYSNENRHHTAESVIDRNGWIPRGRLMAKLAQIGVLLLCTANPDKASASISPKTVNMSYGQENDKDNTMVYTDTEEKCTKSYEQILKINSKASLLVEFTDSLENLDNKDKIATLASDFISLAEEYGANPEIIRAILKKGNISKEDKNTLIEQAKKITQSWAEIVEQHYSNLKDLQSILTDKSAKAEVKSKIEETVKMYVSFTNHVKFLEGLMNQ